METIMSSQQIIFVFYYKILLILHADLTFLLLSIAIQSECH